MHEGKYVFAQLIQFLPARVFDRCVSQYEGNKGVRHFSCWNQMLCMMFGQLAGRESLRDLLITLQAHKSKYYHLGLGKNISRSNLSEVNENRDYRIYETFAYELIAMARKRLIAETDFSVPIQENVYAFDSTTIDLCLNIFWWATFKRAKAAIKLHTLYDVKTAIPVFVHITDAQGSDVRALDVLDYEYGGFYILDRGYIDYKRLHAIHEQKAFFVTRAKNNFSFLRKKSAPRDKSGNIRCDQTIILKGHYAHLDFPDTMRRIKYYDIEQKRTLIFLTNNFALPAGDIALLYKYRWKVELFFKWIKQHLKVKSFWGISKNAVKTQVYIAIITYTLITLVKNQLCVKMSTYEMLQILSVSLFDKTPVNQLLKSNTLPDKSKDDCNQLKINLI
jgi:hypothetical protein